MLRAKTKELPINIINERFNYDKETGIITWKQNRIKNLVGKEAGRVNNNGYRNIKIGTVSYSASRIAWAISFGTINSNLVIDHIDRNRLNNRLINLRLVTQKENCLNKIAKGWTLHKSGKYQVQYKGKYVGLFNTLEEAKAAYEQAKAQA
jgi:hypothetical protein